MENMNMMYGGYPGGYPPQNYGQQNSYYENLPVPNGYESQYSPFIQPYMGQQNTMNNTMYMTDPGYAQPAPPSYTGGNPYITQQQPVQNQNMQVSGFNPFMANPQAVQQQQQYYNPQPQPYNMPMPNPYYGYGQQPYSPNPYYGYNSYGGSSQYNYNNQFNSVVEQSLYGNNIPEFDPFDCLRDAVLSDSEKQKARLNTPVGYGYNGAPLYNADQLRYQREQEENAKNEVLNFWIKLSKAAHHNDNVTDEEIENHYMPKIDVAVQQPRYTSMSTEELMYEQEKAQVENTAVIHQMFEKADYVNACVAQQVSEGYRKIKESHDRILGVDSENMNLRNYMANAGALYVDAISRKQKNMAKDGTLRYSRSAYGSMFANNTTTPTASDYEAAFSNDEYIPLETRIREKYIKAKSKMMVLPDGSLAPSTPPPSVDPEIQEARDSFLKEAMKGMVV